VVATEHSRFHTLNLAWAVALTIGISAVMVLVSFAIFVQSGAYDTVKQISAAAGVLQTGLDDIDTTSPIQAIDIEDYAKTLPQRVKPFNDTEDFAEVSL
jgi:hypothetical protein